MSSARDHRDPAPTEGARIPLAQLLRRSLRPLPDFVIEPNLDEVPLVLEPAEDITKLLTLADVDAAAATLPPGFVSMAAGNDLVRAEKGLHDRDITNSIKEPPRTRVVGGKMLREFGLTKAEAIAWNFQSGNILNFPDPAAWSPGMHQLSSAAKRHLGLELDINVVLAAQKPGLSATRHQRRDSVILGLQGDVRVSIDAIRTPEHRTDKDFDPDRPYCIQETISQGQTLWLPAGSKYKFEPPYNGAMFAVVRQYTPGMSVRPFELAEDPPELQPLPEPGIIELAFRGRGANKLFGSTGDHSTHSPLL